MFDLADALLARTDLTPAQLAELRAINTMYQTALATDPRTGSEGAASILAPRAVLDTPLGGRVVERLRAMLHADQIGRFDEHLAALRAL